MEAAHAGLASTWQPVDCGVASWSRGFAPDGAPTLAPVFLVRTAKPAPAWTGAVPNRVASKASTSFRVFSNAFVEGEQPGNAGRAASSVEATDCQHPLDLHTLLASPSETGCQSIADQEHAEAPASEALPEPTEQVAHAGLSQESNCNSASQAEVACMADSAHDQRPSSELTLCEQFEQDTQQLTTARQCPTVYATIKTEGSCELSPAAEKCQVQPILLQAAAGTTTPAPSTLQATDILAASAERTHDSRGSCGTTVTFQAAPTRLDLPEVASSHYMGRARHSKPLIQLQPHHRAAPTRVIVHGMAVGPLLQGAHAEKRVLVSPWASHVPASMTEDFGRMGSLPHGSEMRDRPGQDGLESRCSSERCSSSEKPAFPPLPRPLQPRHSFTLQASSGIGAATIRLNDVRVTAPGPNPKLLFTAPREGSPVLSCTQEDAMEPACKSKDALQASDDEGEIDDRLAAETLMSLMGLFKRPTKKAAGHSRRIKAQAKPASLKPCKQAVQKSKPTNKKKLSVKAEGAHPILGIRVPQSRRSIAQAAQLAASSSGTCALPCHRLSVPCHIPAGPASPCPPSPPLPRHPSWSVTDRACPALPSWPCIDTHCVSGGLNILQHPLLVNSAAASLPATGLQVRTGRHEQCHHAARQEDQKALAKAAAMHDVQEDEAPTPDTISACSMQL